MTQRLYYTDAYLRAFEATVERVDRRGDRLLVTLDRTAFYPSWWAAVHTGDIGLPVSSTSSTKTADRLRVEPDSWNPPGCPGCH
jgi:Ser-tRNA(Ala) deacylase AlaX